MITAVPGKETTCAKIEIKNFSETEAFETGSTLNTFDKTSPQNYIQSA